MSMRKSNIEDALQILLDSLPKPCHMTRLSSDKDDVLHRGRKVPKQPLAA